MPETIVNAIEAMAREDYECGSVFDIDDYNEFETVCKEDGLEVTPDAFDFYFECVDEFRAMDSYYGA